MMFDLNKVRLNDLMVTSDPKCLMLSYIKLYNKENEISCDAPVTSTCYTVSKSRSN